MSNMTIFPHKFSAFSMARRIVFGCFIRGLRVFNVVLRFMFGIHMFPGYEQRFYAFAYFIHIESKVIFYFFEQKKMPESMLAHSMIESGQLLGTDTLMGWVELIFKKNMHNWNYHTHELQNFKNTNVRLLVSSTNIISENWEVPRLKYGSRESSFMVW